MNNVSITSYRPIRENGKMRFVITYAYGITAPAYKLKTKYTAHKPA